MNHIKTTRKNNDNDTIIASQDAIIGRLSQVWARNPELRLGQLIGNVYHYPSGLDPYFDSNEVFTSKIEEFYEN